MTSNEAKAKVKELKKAGILAKIKTDGSYYVQEVGIAKNQKHPRVWGNKRAAEVAELLD